MKRMQQKLREPVIFGRAYEPTFAEQMRNWQGKVINMPKIRRDVIGVTPPPHRFGLPVVIRESRSAKFWRIAGSALSYVSAVASLGLIAAVLLMTVL